MRAAPFARLALAVLLLSATAAHGQGFFRGRPIIQNEPPAAEFTVARLHFGTNGQFRLHHMGWSHNYPQSELHLNQALAEKTRTDVHPDSYRIVELGSDEVFDYPFAYVSEPGEMELTPQEVNNLREYVQRGGFVLIDDFDGPGQFGNMQKQLRRVFPERDLVRLGADHPIFDLVFKVEDLMGMAPYVPGGMPIYYALVNRAGDVALVACLNNDLANFWEWYDQPGYPLKPSADAFRMGIDYVVYGMTH